jgi:hypothetical protein
MQPELNPPRHILLLRFIVETCTIQLSDNLSYLHAFISTAGTITWPFGKGLPISSATLTNAGSFSNRSPLSLRRTAQRNSYADGCAYSMIPASAALSRSRSKARLRSSEDRCGCSQAAKAARKVCERDSTCRERCER